VVAWSLSYALVAAGVDWLTGANYGFLRAKPPFPTVFDFMPDWPWYVPLLVLLGLMSTAIYYAPFLVWDKVRQVRSRHVETVRYS
jgi:uncharacterized membrane protein YwaF